MANLYYLFFENMSFSNCNFLFLNTFSSLVRHYGTGVSKLLPAFLLNIDEEDIFCRFHGQA